LFISADAAQEKEKKNKKVLLLTGVSKSAAHRLSTPYGKISRGRPSLGMWILKFKHGLVSLTLEPIL
jgi:hypothetical protein